MLYRINLRPTAYALRPRRGFTLVETLVGAVVLSLLAVAVYQSYAVVIATTIASRSKIAATLLANEAVEIMRNLPYTDVAIAPGGKVPADQMVTRDGTSFGVHTTIQSVDDPYDGMAPSDTSPADYKRVQVTISCASRRDFSPVSFTTIVAP